MSSIAISCLAPKPPPIRGLTTRIRRTGKPDNGGEHAPHVERNLGRGADDETLVLVEPGDRDVWFDWALLHLVDSEGVLEHVVGVAPTRHRRRSGR